MDRVERYVPRASDQDVLGFLHSYSSSFNMVGVAVSTGPPLKTVSSYLDRSQGALAAQVAISAMSLPMLEDSHWTAQAIFVLSLTAGVLAVFFACAINPAIHGLHNAGDVKDFLTKPATSAARKDLDDYPRRLRKSNKLQGRQERHITAEDASGVGAIIAKGRWKVASPFAALMLIAPMLLLGASLNAFVVGLGIYLGKIFTANLMPTFRSGSFGTLLFCAISAFYGFALFSVAQALKLREDRPLIHFDNVLNGSQAHKDQLTEQANGNTQETIEGPQTGSGPTIDGDNSVAHDLPWATCFMLRVRARYL